MPKGGASECVPRSWWVGLQSRTSPLFRIIAWVGGHRAIFEKKSPFSPYVVLEPSYARHTQFPIGQSSGRYQGASILFVRHQGAPLTYQCVMLVHPKSASFSVPARCTNVISRCHPGPRMSSLRE